MMLSAINDPDGALERKKHKLKRREYHSKVSNMQYTYLHIMSSRGKIAFLNGIC